MPVDGDARALELLQKLARQPLPVALADPAEIERLDLLKASGYLIAVVSAPHGGVPSVRTSIITHKGWLALSPKPADRSR